MSLPVDIASAGDTYKWRDAYNRHTKFLFRESLTLGLLRLDEGRVYSIIWRPSTAIILLFNTYLRSRKNGPDEIKNQ